MSDRTVLVAGGAGFIGSALVRRILREPDVRVVTLDALTYSGHRENLEDLPNEDRHRFVEGDIADRALVGALMDEVRPFGVINTAAETHVDRSILEAAAFVRTNALGTQVLLDHTRRLGVPLVQVSTDEVYGSVPSPTQCTPASPLNPSNPYAASKAGGDLLALAAFRTHGQDVRITRCTNNYGPRQLPEKFIPLMTLKALAGEKLPVYGDGTPIRDWIHVDDHVEGLWAALVRGNAGVIYHFAGNEPRRNLDVVHAVLSSTGAPASLVAHVADRPAHDQRYALDDRATREALDWTTTMSFDEGLQTTIAWYRENTQWAKQVSSPALQAFFERNYGSR